MIILCGGLGKRLRSTIGETQKTMASVGDEPFLNLVLKYLKGQGFRRVILATGYQAEKVEDHYRANTIGLQIKFSREDQPLGTGGAIKKAAGLAKSDPVMAMNGDCFCPVDYAQFLEFHRKKKTEASLVVATTPERKDYGSIIFDAASGRVQRFAEKELAADISEGPSYINAGIYCLSHRALSWMPAQEVFSIERDYFPTVIEKGLFGFPVTSTFLDIGTPDRYTSANEILSKEITRLNSAEKSRRHP